MRSEQAGGVLLLAVYCECEGVQMLRCQGCHGLHAVGALMTPGWQVYLAVKPDTP